MSTATSQNEKGHEPMFHFTTPLVDQTKPQALGLEDTIIPYVLPPPFGPVSIFFSEPFLSVQ